MSLHRRQTAIRCARRLARGQHWWICQISATRWVWRDPRTWRGSSCGSWRTCRMLEQVPVIDLAPFLDGDLATRQRAARTVGQACEEIGFFTLVGHGVDPALVRATQDTARDFFDLPYEEKMRIRRPAPEQNRGYNGVGQEALSYSIGHKTPHDLKEFLSIGPVDVPD